MASRWEMLATVIDAARSDMGDDFGLLDDLVGLCAILHDVDSFYDKAETDGALAIGDPDVGGLIYDYLSNKWATKRFEDYGALPVGIAPPDLDPQEAQFETDE